MPEFLLDMNLPYYFSLWNSKLYIHQRDLQKDANDREIWEYAKRQNLTIISKDVDFTHRILFAQPPPKVIQLKLGNMVMKDFHPFITNCWEEVLELNELHKLVVVYRDRIEATR